MIVSPRSAIVSDTPSSVIDPLYTMYRSRSLLASTVTRREKPSVDDRRDPANAVDVALHHVTAEAILEAHRQLEVDGRAGTYLCQRAQPQRFVHDIRAEAVTVDGGRGQADPVHGDRVPLRQLGRELAADAQAHALGRALDTEDLPEVSYQAGEQLTTP